MTARLSRGLSLFSNILRCLWRRSIRSFQVTFGLLLICPITFLSGSIVVSPLREFLSRRGAGGEVIASASTYKYPGPGHRSSRPPARERDCPPPRLPAPAPSIYRRGASRCPQYRRQHSSPP